MYAASFGHALFLALLRPHLLRLRKKKGALSALLFICLSRHSLECGRMCPQAYKLRSLPVRRPWSILARAAETNPPACGRRFCLARPWKRRWHPYSCSDLISSCWKIVRPLLALSSQREPLPRRELPEFLRSRSFSSKLFLSWQALCPLSKKPLGLRAFRVPSQSLPASVPSLARL